MKHLKDQIEKYINDGLLYRQWHSNGELQILNYSQTVQYSKLWDDFLIQARGLILTKEYQLVSRPLKKFWNMEELTPEEIPNEPFEVYEKLDGSCLILYWIMGKPFVATRGSFESDQAKWGNEILYKKYYHCFDELRKLKEQNITAIWELLHFQNRIVVDYGKVEDMILLALIDNKTGLDVPLKDIGFPIVKRYDGINDFTKIKNVMDVDGEGFVIKFKHSKRLKIKHTEYCRLHKIITQTSNVSIWEALKNGVSLEDAIQNIPDEFFDFYKQTKLDLENKYQTIQNRAIEAYAKIILQLWDDYLIPHEEHSTPAFWQRFTKKDFALKVMENYKDISGILFNILETPDKPSKPYKDIIWKMIKPRYSKPYKLEI